MGQQEGGNEGEVLDGKGLNREREKSDFLVFPHAILCKFSVLLLKETCCKEHLVSPLHGWELVAQRR